MDKYAGEYVCFINVKISNNLAKIIIVNASWQALIREENAVIVCDG